MFLYIIRIATIVLSVLCFKEENSFEPLKSLTYPLALQNGKNNIFKFNGDYTIQTNSRNNFLSLGFVSGKTMGYITHRDPINFPNFKLITSFSMPRNNPSKKSSIYFCLKESPSSDNVSEVSNVFKSEGISVVITFNGDYAEIIVKETKKDTTNVKKLIKKMSYSLGRTYKLIIEKQRQNTVTVSISLNSKEPITIYSGEATIPSNPYFSLLSYGFSDYSNLLIKSISFYKKKRYVDVYIKGESKANNKMVLLLGLIGIIYLLYYLYNNGIQRKTISIK